MGTLLVDSILSAPTPAGRQLCAYKHLSVLHGKVVTEGGMTKGRYDKQAARSVIAPALAPLRGAAAGSIVEREILRVVSTIPGNVEVDILQHARREVLKWATKRAGGNLPDHAWQGDAFEMLSVGRTTMGATVQTESSSLWSLRGDDPDKTVPGRIWSTEVSLGQSGESGDVLLGVRLLVNSTEAELVIEPSVPGLVLQIADTCGLRDGPISIQTRPHYAETEEHADLLVEWLRLPARRLPLLVATGDERTKTPDNPLLNVELLAKSLCGLAHVISLPASLTYKLSDMLGKELTVFHGGVRIYNPGPNIYANPRAHQLYMGATLAKTPDSVVAEIRESIARESLRRTRLGHDVLSFAAVRSAALRLQQSRQIAEGAPDTEQLAAARTRNDALEQEVIGLRAEADQALELSIEEAERAEDSEKLLFSAWARIEQLEAVLKANDTVVGDGDTEPSAWEDFAAWCDGRFSSRLTLAPAARRAVRDPDFLDVGLAARCIEWLASEARDRFLSGGGALANIPIFDGVTNAPCGADEYKFNFQGRRLLANWHVKNGGNTRQPERCLRIYYTFDEITRQIIVSDMPAHRHTSAT